MCISLGNLVPATTVPVGLRLASSAKGLAWSRLVTAWPKLWPWHRPCDWLGNDAKSIGWWWTTWIYIYIYMFLYIYIYYILYILYILYIYIYLRQMPGLCPEPQPRQATHHHHHHHHVDHHQTWLKIFNECRSFTGAGELNPYWRSSMNVEV